MVSAPRWDTKLDYDPGEGDTDGRFLYEKDYFERGDYNEENYAPEAKLAREGGAVAYRVYQCLLGH